MKQDDVELTSPEMREAWLKLYAAILGAVVPGAMEVIVSLENKRSDGVTQLCAHIADCALHEYEIRIAKPQAQHAQP